MKLPDNVTIDATGTVVITLTAEDGSTKGTYTLTTEMAQANTDASITAFYIGDYKAQLTKSGGVNQEDIFTVTVPYMTLDVANLPIYATPLLAPRCSLPRTPAPMTWSMAIILPVIFLQV